MGLGLLYGYSVYNVYVFEGYHAKKHEFTKEPFTSHIFYTSDVEEHRTKTGHHQISYYRSRILRQRTSRLKFRERRYPILSSITVVWQLLSYHLGLARYKDWPMFPSLPLFLSSFSFTVFHFLQNPAIFTMKSNLPFLTYLVAFFATHTTCAPQRTFGDSLYVSSGQTCKVAGYIVRVLPKKKKLEKKKKRRRKNSGIQLLYNMNTNFLLPQGDISFYQKGTYLTALGEIKKSCNGLAFDPRSFSYGK